MMASKKRAQVYISSDASSSGIDNSAPAKRVTPRTRSGPHKHIPARKQHETQDENDESQTARQYEEKLKNVNANLAALKTREKAFKDFEKQVLKDRNELLALLHELTGQKNDNKELRQKLKQLVQDQIPELSPGMLELQDHLEAYGNEKMSPIQQQLFDKINTAPSFHTLHRTAGEVLSASKNLLATYQELNRPLAQQLDTEIQILRAQWAQDKMETQRLLDVGKQVAQQRIKKMMPKSVRDTSVSIPTVQPLGSEDEIGPINQQLQQAFMQTTRGVSHLVRNLPKQ